MDNERVSSIGGRGDLYEDFVDMNYQLENEMSMRSSYYSNKMRGIK